MIKENTVLRGSTEELLMRIMNVLMKRLNIKHIKLNEKECEEMFSDTEYHSIALEVDSENKTITAISVSEQEVEILRLFKKFIDDEKADERPVDKSKLA